MVQLQIEAPLGVATHLDGIKKVCVVGGGVGCAIALPIAEALHEMGADVTSVVGFRNKELVILEEEFTACSDRLEIMADDGSYGEKGNVTMPTKIQKPVVLCPMQHTFQKLQMTT